MDDRELLQQYEGGSESAFAELVRRHLNWVYSAAWRQVGDAHLAEEVAQSVFVLLARKAGSLRSSVVLSGWLFRTTRFVASRALRAELRRKRREQEASAMNPSTTDETDAVWQRLAPHLDQAVASLSEPDRSAVLLRFYEKKTLEDVGRRLGISEEAAKKRVSRAVDKMRDFLSRRGLTLGTAALISVVGVNTVKAAPAVLAFSVINTSSAAAASASLPELARQTLNAWRWMKVKLATALTAAVAVGVAVLKLQNASVDLPNSSGGSTNQTDSALLNARNQTASTEEDTQAHLSRNLPPGSVGGLVLDERDSPISHAHVWAGSAYGPDSEAQTDRSGRFILTAIGRRNSATVSSPGFSADQQNIDANDLSKPMVFRLSPVGPLRFRIIDEIGVPIKGADVCLENWWGQRDTLMFRQPTAEDGRVEWNFAPKGELEFCALKSGYLTSRRHKMVADNEEHVFVLHPALTVSGKVTDADSEAPIAGFTLTRGYSQIFSSSIGESSPIWDLQDRWHGTNGFYKVIFDEENIPQLHVEAEGYEVLEVKPQFTNGPQTVCDFQLHRVDTSNTIRGIVLLPNGGPAADVEVALGTFQVSVWVNGTRFQKGVNANRKVDPADYRQKTDQRGEFSFSPQPGSHTVVAVSSDGIGKVRCFDFSQPLEIHLQPWGRVQGTLRFRDLNPGNRHVTWGAMGTLNSGMDVYFNGDDVAAVSDVAGGFLIEHVPPGDGHLAVTDGKATLCEVPVHVLPGQTLQLQLGETGSSVAGKLIAPRGVDVKSWSNQLYVAEISSQWDQYSVPKGLSGEKLWRWQMEFSESDAGRAQLGRGFHYRLSVQPDGSFFVPDVFPGRYQVIVTLNEGSLGSGPSSPNPFYLRQIASIWHKFEVSETSTGGASRIDLGDLVLNASP